MHYANIKFVVNIQIYKYTLLIMWSPRSLGLGLKQQVHLFCLTVLSLFWGLVHWPLGT